MTYELTMQPGLMAQPVVYAPAPVQYAAQLPPPDANSLQPTLKYTPVPKCIYLKDKILNISGKLAVS